MFEFGPVVMKKHMPMKEEPIGELDILDGLRAMSMFKRDPGPLRPTDLNQDIKHALVENPHCIQKMYDEGFFDESLIRELEQMMHDSSSMMMPRMMAPGRVIAVQAAVVPNGDLMLETGGPKKKKKKKKKPIPTNKALYARVKAEAKRKFDVYPSAYANAWLVRTYKKRGGGYRMG